MEIALHLGVHLTDDGRLLRCLVKNRDTLFAEGIEVPGPGRYRETLIRMAGAAAEGTLAPDAGTHFLDDVLDSDETRRLVLSEPNVLSWKSAAVRSTGLYPAAASRLAGLREAFGDHDVTLFLALRNPASLLPALMPHLKPHAVTALASVRPQTLRWLPFVAALRQAWPEAGITLWCDEDTPFLWHRLLADVSGHGAETQLAHTYDWFEQIMVDGGAQKLERYMATTPPVDEAHRQRVIAAFLDKFYDSEKLDIDVNVPGWTENTVDTVSALYEDDVDALATLSDVTLLQP
ncbi:MAG: hypothetical protein ACK4HW_06710 [Roseinatronobacter sp.]